MTAVADAPAYPRQSAAWLSVTYRVEVVITSVNQASDQNRASLIYNSALLAYARIVGILHNMLRE